MPLKLPSKKLAPSPSKGLALKKPGLKPSGLNRPGKATGFGGGPPKGKVSSGGAFAHADVEQKAYEARRSMPFRLSIPYPSSLEVYFLDKGEPFYCYEHNIGGSKTSRGKLYPCIKDTNEPCPACAKDPKGDGYFVMFLTAVVPVREFTNKEGEHKTYRFQKMLFPVKVKMSAKYKRLYQAHGTFRGMVVKIHRDGQMDAGTGSDVEFVRMLPEKEIQKYAANPKYKENKLAEPFDYAKLFAKPSAKELAAMVGAAGTAAGSADFNDDDDFGSSAEGWDVD